MHIVAIAWLYVTATMALAIAGAAGAAFFVVAGIGPLALLVALAARRRRRSVREDDVHDGDDPHP